MDASDTNSPLYAEILGNSIVYQDFYVCCIILPYPDQLHHIWSDCYVKVRCHIAMFTAWIRSSVGVYVCDKDKNSVAQLRLI